MDLNDRLPQTGVMTTAMQDLNERTGYTVVSTHRTSQGDVTYVRCNACGGLRMLSPSLSAGGHGDRCPVCD
jgi:NAD-dependent SIR2 family protein deacetylase